jgi:hypothetical protein
MRYCFLLVTLAACVCNAHGQAPNSDTQRRYIAPPPANLLLTVASLPDSPLRFENARLLIDVDGRGLAVVAQVRNVGTKPVRYYSPVIWTSMATGGTISGSVWSSGKVHDKVILPGQVVSEEDDIVTVTLTDELRDKLKLKEPMRAVVVLMIERVVFDDGSVYSAEPISKALLEHFEKMAP